MSDTEMDRVRELLREHAGVADAYRPRRRAEERLLTAWERKYGVAMPDEYRAFLRQLGNGGTMPGPYCDFVLLPLAEVQGGPHATTPFPISAERLATRYRQLAAEGRPADGVLFPELEPYWEQYDRPPGCVTFGQYPSSDALFLVTAGELRGTVWCGVCFGTPEVKADKPLSFLAWLADALDELLHGEFGPAPSSEG